MYPLNVQLPAPLIGFAVASDETEHQALTVAGYLPAYEAPIPDADPAEGDGAGHTVESVRAQLDALNIAYDKRIGLAKLLALLPA